MADSFRQQRDARSIFDAGLASADPQTCIFKALALHDSRLLVGETEYDLDAVSQLIVLGAGKATPAMAAAVEDILGTRINSGLINTKYGHSVALEHIDTVECGHPIPDEPGIEGTRRQLALLEGLDEQALIIALFSGGGSALLPAPALGINIAEKQQTTRLLLACGATIGEVNAIRKHLSAIKGGRLSRQAYPARVLALMLSDVIGDSLDTIASGPTYPDATSYSDCLHLIDHYALRRELPLAIRERLEAGGRGEIGETPKADDSCFDRVHNRVVGNNSLAVDAAAARARDLGYNVLTLTTRLQGEASTVGTALAAIGQEVRQAGRPIASPACIIAGGETTVTLRGQGKGGRNQELALAAGLALDGWEGITFLSAGTDGTDGPTDAAGAIVDGSTIQRGKSQGLAARAYLQNNDSYHYFQPLGDLLITGATGTNVMDLQIVLIS
ncbi:MAG: glycerate kinase type-2 family protein [Candidatus Latescibacterota bacterium]|jgi:glycerate 2-kinase